MFGPKLECVHHYDTVSTVTLYQCVLNEFCDHLAFPAAHLLTVQGPAPQTNIDSTTGVRLC